MRIQRITIMPAARAALAVLGAIALAACSEPGGKSSVDAEMAALAPAPVVNPGVKADTVTTMAVVGMHCEGCTEAVRKSLMELPGVQRADIELRAKQAIVSYDSSQTSVSAFVRSVVDGAGYKASETSSTTSRLQGS